MAGQEQWGFQYLTRWSRASLSKDLPEESEDSPRRYLARKRVCQGQPSSAKALGSGAYQVCSRNSREVWVTTTEPTREMTNEMTSE